MEQLMSPEDYKVRFGDGSKGVVASRPASNELSRADLQDGRFWGDELWGLFTTEAHSADAAAKVSAVSFCVSMIATTVGSLSREVRDEKGNVVSDFDFGNIVLHTPNPLQTGDEFWASMAYRAALGGNAFAEPVIGEDFELWPLDPCDYDVDWGRRSFRLTYTDENGQQRNFGPDRLFWFSGMSDSKVKPLTPWKLAQGPINFALALEAQGRDFFKNGTRLAGVLSTDQKLDDEIIGRLKSSIARWKNGQTPVLEQGLKYEQMVSTNSDAQMVELIRQRTLEIARYWHIPRSMIGEDGGTAASQEQQALEYVKYTIRPWVRRIEQAMTHRLLTPDQREKFSFKFNLDSLLRGDSATQWRNAVLARTSGVLSRNTIATKWFDEPRIEEDWADDPREPLNSNRAADTTTGGQTAPQDMTEAPNG